MGKQEQSAQHDATGETRVERQTNLQRGDAFYNDFYRNGGWQYKFWREYLWHRRHVVKRFGLRRGMRVLEVACGNGFHTNLFRRMGFACTGVDRSTNGIEWAKSHFPKSTYHCADIMGDMPVEPGTFDVVLARGCSNYHYDMHGEQAHATTHHLMRYLRPGGVFVMTILTDLSGRRPPDQVWHNKLSDYDEHFRSFGLRYSVDWHKGMVICGLHNEPVTRVLSEATRSRTEVAAAQASRAATPEHAVGSC